MGGLRGLARILLEADASHPHPPSAARRFVMSKHLSFMFALTAAALLHAGCGESDPGGDADQAIQQVYEGKLSVAQAQSGCRCKLEVVPVGGTVFHFGYDLSQSPPVPYPFQSTVARARAP